LDLYAFIRVIRGSNSFVFLFLGGSAAWRFNRISRTKKPAISTNKKASSDKKRLAT
jgi:hypothetical protein